MFAGATYYNNNERYPDGCWVLTAKQMLDYHKVHKTCPLHVRNTKIIKDAMFTHSMKFSVGGKVQVPTPDFADVVARFWEPFADSIVDYIVELSLIPMQLLVLPDKTKVPQTLCVGTFDLVGYYSFASEKQCYDVYRVRTGSGLSVPLGKKRIIGECSDYAGLSRRKHRALSAQDNDTAPIPLDALDSDDENDAVETGPSKNDWRANQARRVDLGMDFPEDMMPDPTCIVLSVGSDPDVEGNVNSIIAASIASYLDYHTHNALATLEEQKLAAYVPFLQPSPMATEYMQYLRTGRSVQTSVTQDPAVANGAAFVVGKQEEAFRRLHLQQQSEEASRHARNTGIGNLAALGRMKSHTESLVALQNLTAYANTYMFRGGSNQPYYEVPSAATIANAPPPIGGQNLQYFKQTFEENVMHLYTLPMIRNQSALQGNVEMQQDSLTAVQNRWVQMVSKILTRVYAGIYGNTDYVNEITALQRQWTNEHVVRRITKQFCKAAYDTKVAMFHTLVEAASLRKDDFPFPREQMKPFFQHRKLTPELSSDTYTKNKTKTKKRDRFESALPDILNSDFDPKKLLRMDEKKVLDDVFSESDPRIADLSIEMMFCNALQKCSPSKICKTFESGSDDDRNWLKQKEQSLGERARKAVSKRHKKDSPRNTETLVTFTTNSPMSTDDIYRARVMKCLKRHEYRDLIRCRAGVSVGTNDDDDSDQEDDPISRWHDIIESSEMEKLVANTPMLPLLQVTKEGLRQHDQDIIMKTQANAKMAHAASGASDPKKNKDKAKEKKSQETKSKGKTESEEKAKGKGTEGSKETKSKSAADKAEKPESSTKEKADGKKS